MELRNGQLALRIERERGGKIVSLVRLATGFEFLLQRDRRLADVPPEYGAVYDASRSYGFDECVPTVAPCIYAEEPFRDRPMPDHGDVWTHVALCERLSEVSAACTVEGRSLPYLFEKTIALDGDSLLLSYRLQNGGESAFYYTWTAHPLLAADDDTSIVLPATLDEPKVDAFGSYDRGYARTRFTRRLRSDEGRFQVIWPNAGEELTLRFDAAEVPYAGIWITRGGWPEGSTYAQNTLAVEPALAPGSLAEAISAGLAPTLEPGAVAEWRLAFDVR